MIITWAYSLFRTTVFYSGLFHACKIDTRAYGKHGKMIARGQCFIFALVTFCHFSLFGSVGSSEKNCFVISDTAGGPAIVESRLRDDDAGLSMATIATSIRVASSSKTVFCR